MATEVLLWEDVPEVGRRGEIVRVSPGYARNFLFPRKLAVKPTPGNRRMFDRERERVARRVALRAKQSGGVLAALERTSVTIEANANAEGMLYGSVDGRAISDAFRKLGVPVAPDMVRIEDPIKKVGAYAVAIRPHGELVGTAKVFVVAAGDVVKPKA